MRQSPGLRTLRYFLTVGLLSASPASVQAQGAAPLAGFAAEVEQARTDWGVPGLAVAVVKDGEVAFAQGFGVREQGAPERVDEHTLFSIGSTTKAFTVAALALLVEEGKVAWDAPVITYLPGFRVADPYVTRQLTVRDLLTHRSGVESTDLLWVAGYDRDEIVRRLRHAEQASSLRSQWAYNNSLYVVAGEIVEAVAGTSWETFVRQRILQPLGMNETLMISAGIEDRPNVAMAHDTQDGTVEVLPFPHIDTAGPAGSMQSSVADMARWITCLLRRGRIGDTTLLQPDTVTELFRPQMLLDDPIYPAARQAKPHFFAYGLGWFLQDYRGRRLVMHTGSIWGMSAIVALIPEEGVGMVALLNHDHAELRHALMYRVFDRYLDSASPEKTGTTDKDWSGDLLALYRSEATAPEAREEAASPQPPRLPLTSYAGLYIHPLYGELVIYAPSDSGAGLILRWNGPAGSVAELTHRRFDTFQATYRDPRLGDMVIRFGLNARGEVHELEIVGLKTFRRLRPAAE